MAGRIIDLNRPGILWPEAVLLDSSVIVPRFLPTVRRTSPASATSHARAGALLADLAAQGTLAFVAAAGFTELAHLVLRTRDVQDLGTYVDPVNGRPFPSWTRLYKQRPDLVLGYAADIEALRRALESAAIEVLQPSDLGPLPADRRVEEELIRLIRRYRLDSADAAILIEAGRAGIGGVVSEDPDWQRAAQDFDVYTWL